MKCLPGEPHSEAGPIAVLETGIHAIDASIGGLPVGGLTLLAGRPSTGKTSLALTIAAEMALSRGIPGAVFMLEFNLGVLLHRLPELVSASTWGRLQAHAPLDQSGKGVDTVAAMLTDSPLHLDDSPGLCVAEIQTRTTRLLRDGVRFVVVDYLQLVAGDPHSESRAQQMATAVKDLRNLAARSQVAVLVTSQLRRPRDRPGFHQPRLLDSEEGALIRPHIELLLELGMVADAPLQRELRFERRPCSPSGMVRLERASATGAFLQLQ